MLQSSHFGIVPKTGHHLRFKLKKEILSFEVNVSYRALISERVSIPAFGEKRHFGHEVAIVYCTY